MEKVGTNANSFWCKIGFHTWGPWSAPYRYPDRVFQFHWQRRVCLCCNKTQEKTCS